MALNPIDIGLPAKFTEFREGQFETAVQMASTDKRFTILSAPTGAGKSVDYMTAALLLQVRTLFSTPNKGLQKQLIDDFGAIGLTDIRGQSNYRCVLLQKKNARVYHGCDDGPCHHGKPCAHHPKAKLQGEYEPGCHFYDQLEKIRKSQLVVTNLDFLMSANRYMEPGMLGNFGALVIDEAHDSPEKLAEFCTVELTADECDEWLNAALPPVEDGAEAWVAWVDKFRAHLLYLEEGLKAGDDHDPGYAKKLRNFVGRVRFLGSARKWERSEPASPAVDIPGVSPDWVGERIGDRAVFSPVWAHMYAERFLYVGVPRVFLSSATIMKQTARYAGIPNDKLQFIENVNAFAPHRRPVYFMPTAHLNKDSGESDYRAISVRINQILQRRQDRKALILVPSFDLSYRLREMSAFRTRMQFNKRGDDVQKVVEKFKAAAPGTSLISPSLAQGYDFPYADCEVLIIPKMPFIDSRSLVMQARARSDKTYLNYAAALKLVQMCGRAMRAKDDQCEIFILDNNFGWFLRAAKQMLPPWFLAAVKQASINPEPPEALEVKFERERLLRARPWLGSAY